MLYAPDHLDAVSHHWHEIRRDVRHGRVCIGEKDIVGYLDWSRNDQELQGEGVRISIAL
jgi:hypothetical protein